MEENLVVKEADTPAETPKQASPEAPGTSKQVFVPLHIHTEFSMGDAYGTIPLIIKNLKQKGFDACAISDHGFLGGVLNFQQTCLEAGIKPILGIEAYVIEDEKDKESGHMVLLAKNKTGWDNLLWLNGQAATKYFHYRPRMLLSDILSHSAGLICMTACTSGLVSKKIIAGETVGADILISQLKMSFGEDFYVEIIFNDSVPNQKEVNQFLLKQATEKNIKAVVTSDSHYPNKEDEKIHKAIKAISMRMKYEQAGFSDKTFYYLQDKDIMELASRHPYVTPEAVKQMIANTREVADKCSFLIQKETGSLLPDMMKFLLPSAGYEAWLQRPDTHVLSKIGKVADE